MICLRCAQQQKVQHEKFDFFLNAGRLKNGKIKSPRQLFTKTAVFAIPAFTTFTGAIVTEASYAIAAVVTLELITEGATPAVVAVTLLVAAGAMVTLQTANLCSCDNPY